MPCNAGHLSLKKNKMFILPKTIILSPLFCFSKKRLFEEVADFASCELNTHAKDLIFALNEREKKGTTVCFDGIAIPHASISDIPNTLGILSILDKPILFNSIDAQEQNVDIAYTFFISQNEDYTKIENLLKELSQQLAHNDLLNALRLCRGEKNKVSDILNKMDLSLNKIINGKQ